MKLEDFIDKLIELHDEFGNIEVYSPSDPEGNKIFTASVPSVEITDDPEGEYDIYLNDSDYESDRARNVVVIW